MSYNNSICYNNLNNNKKTIDVDELFDFSKGNSNKKEEENEEEDEFELKEKEYLKKKESQKNLIKKNMLMIEPMSKEDELKICNSKAHISDNKLFKAKHQILKKNNSSSSIFINKTGKIFYPNIYANPSFLYNKEISLFKRSKKNPNNKTSKTNVVKRDLKAILNLEKENFKTDSYFNEPEYSIIKQKSKFNNCENKSFNINLENDKTIKNHLNFDKKNTNCKDYKNSPHYFNRPLMNQNIIEFKKLNTKSQKFLVSCVDPNNPYSISYANKILRKNYKEQIKIPGLTNNMPIMKIEYMKDDQKSKNNKEDNLNNKTGSRILKKIGYINLLNKCNNNNYNNFNNFNNLSNYLPKEENKKNSIKNVEDIPSYIINDYRCKKCNNFCKDNNYLNKNSVLFNIKKYDYILSSEVQKGESINNLSENEKLKKFLKIKYNKLTPNNLDGIIEEIYQF